MSSWRTDPFYHYVMRLFISSNSRLLKLALSEVKSAALVFFQLVLACCFSFSLVSLMLKVGFWWITYNQILVFKI